MTIASHQRLKTPKALNWGDVVAVIRPSSKLDERDFEETCETIRSQGFCIAVPPLRRKRHSFFAADDQTRGLELEWALLDPRVKAVFCARGGYGSARALRWLQERRPQFLSRLARAQSRIVIGYSDSTYLLGFLLNVAGWKSFHGPLVGRQTKPQLKTFLQDLVNLSQKPRAEIWTEVRSLQTGSAEGLLVGGNLSLLTTTGPASLPRRPLILALEDIHESHYRIDRMLGQLLDGGYDQYIRGIICGHFEKCGQADRKIFPEKIWHESLKKLTDGPIWLNARFGHGVPHQRILPLGSRVGLRAKSFINLEPWVQRS